ncbi:MAG TPA: SUMF1/EgtB/PvdO family nonheme iron enzyme, partial [Thermotogota bacterium]|nr:SUMF1/EgtB/PvdO family nonheme iron enzyme [Thermotogota bacterium]
MINLTNWEYAARGGHKSTRDYKYAGSNDIDEVAWYWRNSGDRYLNGDWDEDTFKDIHSKTHEVGLKKTNELCVFDM